MNENILVSVNGSFSIPLNPDTNEPLESFFNGKTVKENFYLLTNNDKNLSLYFLSDEDVLIKAEGNIENGFFCGIVQAGKGKITVQVEPLYSNSKFSTAFRKASIGVAKHDGKFVLTGNLGE